MFTYLHKSDAKKMLPILYDIMFLNMHDIVPRMLSKEEFISAVIAGLKADNRRILLFCVGEELAGFLQYFVSRDKTTLRIEELQIKPEFQMSGLFVQLMRYMINVLPEDLKSIEGFVHEENIRSQCIQTRLGLAEIGRENGIIHMHGDYQTVREKYLHKRLERI